MAEAAAADDDDDDVTNHKSHYIGGSRSTLDKVSRQTSYLF